LTTASVSDDVCIDGDRNRLEPVCVNGFFFFDPAIDEESGIFD